MNPKFTMSIQKVWSCAFSSDPLSQAPYLRFRIIFCWSISWLRVQLRLNILFYSQCWKNKALNVSDKNLSPCQKVQFFIRFSAYYGFAKIDVLYIESRGTQLYVYPVYTHVPFSSLCSVFHVMSFYIIFNNIFIFLFS